MWAAASALHSVGQAFVDAAEGPASAPPNGVSRNAWSMLRGAITAAGPLVNAAAHSVERKMRQGQMPRAAQDVLMIGLLASRLSEAAYCHDVDCLSAMLSAVPPKEAPALKLVHFSPQGDHTDRVPQWYLARDEGGADGGTRLFLVFRGTFSPHDVLRDLLVTPETHCDATYHGGFLAGVSEDPALHKVISTALQQERPAELLLLGHSLGGSLALTFLAAGFVPGWFRKHGKVTAVAIGSPAVLFTPQSAGTGAVRCPAGAVGARVLVFVNRADAVPRLLGSPLPLMGGFFSSALRRERQRKALATLESYSHLPHTEVVWLNSEGQALAVPEADRDAVLHLHEALSLDLHRTILTDHGGEAYIGGLARALAEGPGGYPGRPSHTPGCTGSLPSVPVGIPVPQGHATEGAVATGSPIDPLYAVAAGPGGLLDRRVAVRGLVSMPEYNGRVGRAVSWDARAGRYSVALDRRAGRGEEVSIKPENLEPR